MKPKFWRRVPARVESYFAPTGLAARGAKVLKVDSEDRAHGNGAANVLDGDPGTFWHTRWQPVNDPMPHELIIDLGRELSIAGVTCWPRQDQSNGRIGDAEFYGSTKEDAWSEALARVRWINTRDSQTARFKQPAQVRYLRMVVRSEVNGNPFVALADIDLLPAGQGAAKE